MHTLPCANGHSNALIPSLRPTPASPAPVLPEAPCSLNVYVEVASLGRVQVTGRGATPSEAVAHLHGTVDLLRLRTTPPAAPSRDARLAQLLTCGLANATARQDWALVERLSKAAALVLAQAVALGHRPGLVTVRSQHTPDTWYEVEHGQCSCPDAAKHPERRCKHKLAVALWLRLEDRGEA